MWNKFLLFSILIYFLNFGLFTKEVSNISGCIYENEEINSISELVVDVLFFETENIPEDEDDDIEENYQIVTGGFNSSTLYLLNSSDGVFPLRIFPFYFFGLRPWILPLDSPPPKHEI